MRCRWQMRCPRAPRDEAPVVLRRAIGFLSRRRVIDYSSNRIASGRRRELRGPPRTGSPRSHGRQTRHAPRSAPLACAGTQWHAPHSRNPACCEPTHESLFYEYRVHAKHANQSAISPSVRDSREPRPAGRREARDAALCARSPAGRARRARSDSESDIRLGHIILVHTPRRRRASGRRQKPSAPTVRLLFPCSRCFERRSSLSAGSFCCRRLRGLWWQLLWQCFGLHLWEGHSVCSRSGWRWRLDGGHGHGGGGGRLVGGGTSLGGRWRRNRAGRHRDARSGVGGGGGIAALAV